MKKYSIIIILLFCVILSACHVSEDYKNEMNDNNLIADDEDNLHSIEMDTYAIYPSTIIESVDAETGEYVQWKNDVHIIFPQIYYSNEYSDYNFEFLDFEAKINQALFYLGLRNDDSFLLGRNNRDLWEYRMNYTITMANEELFSIKYYGHMYTIWRAMRFCYGVTINVWTGDVAEISEYVIVNEELLRGIENREIVVHSSGYDMDYVIELTSNFIMSYDAMPNKSNYYFLTDNFVNLIVPVPYGNGNYIILEIPRI